jgi:hypothetical protein
MKDLVRGHLQSLCGGTDRGLGEHDRRFVTPIQDEHCGIALRNCDQTYPGVYSL